MNSPDQLIGQSSPTVGITSMTADPHQANGVARRNARSPDHHRVASRRASSCEGSPARTLGGEGTLDDIVPNRMNPGRRLATARAIRTGFVLGAILTVRTLGALMFLGAGFAADAVAGGVVWLRRLALDAGSYGVRSGRAAGS